MCGIVGATSHHSVTALLLDGLRRLEYRGYDSAGLAVVPDHPDPIHDSETPIDESQHRQPLQVLRATGRVSALAAALPDAEASGPPIDGRTGIAHTRWATHGGVCRENAHPHTDTDGRVAVVHNGVLDNAVHLRAALRADGVVLRSGTDSEVLPHLIARALEAGASPEEALRAALARVQGTWGVAVAFADHPGLILCARMGSPLVVGLGDGQTLVASDPQALLAHTRRVVFMEDGDLAALRPGGAVFSRLDAPRARPARPVQVLDTALAEAELGAFPDHMAREIAAQPEVLARGIAGRLSPDGTVTLGGLDLGPRAQATLPEALLVGCGTSLHAGQVGALLLRRLARLPARAAVASEVALDPPPLHPDALVLALSQSGETWDTLQAVGELQGRGHRVHGLVNAVGATIARTCGAGVYLRAGPEVSVASTKAFSAQVLALTLLALKLGRCRHLSATAAATLARALAETPRALADAHAALVDAPALERAARLLAGARCVLFTGRGLSAPVAAEGALKLLELAYLPALALPGGELKHGPLALLDADAPVVALVPDDETRTGALTTLAEARTRGAPTVVLHAPGDAEAAALATASLPVALPHPLLAPLLQVLPLQLLARRTAGILGREIDRPRNLAKSVTVA